MNYVQMTNSPAFPDGLGKKGMTLRDYMAAKAMQGMLAGFLASSKDIMWDGIAKDAYRQADAMLKAREA
jgi:hypothetical protein